MPCGVCRAVLCAASLDVVGWTVPDVAVHVPYREYMGLYLYSGTGHGVARATGVRDTVRAWEKENNKAWIWKITVKQLISYAIDVAKCRHILISKCFQLPHRDRCYCLQNQ